MFTTSDIVDGIAKYGCISVLLVYMAFAGLVIRQISLMVRTFKTDNEGLVQSIGWIHFVVTLVFLVLAMIL